MTGSPAGPQLPEDGSAVMREAVGAAVRGEIEALRRFIDRRFDELSVEVLGAAQMVDFSEANLSEQIGSIHGQIASLVAAPAMAARNSGLELEAVVQTTEAAADRILEAAEAIGGWAADGQRDPASLDLLTSKVNAIFEACSFHDLTGQRVHRAIDQLRRIETLLEALMSKAPAAAATPTPMTEDGAELGQQEIDRLLG